VEKDEVHIMTGGMSAAVGYALQPYIDSKEIPMTYPVMAPDDLTQRKIPKWIVRTGWTSSQPNHPLGEYAYNVLKFRKIAVLGMDFAFGWESVGGFQKVFEEALSMGFEAVDLMSPFAYLAHRITIGPLEAFNNTVSRIIHRACGVRNLDYLFLKLRQESLDPVLPK
jgi:ABC-type branched-subunit amino acid transport system substrate-binding protein